MTTNVQRELADRIASALWPAQIMAAHREEARAIAEDIAPTVQRLIADAEKRAAAVALKPFEALADNWQRRLDALEEDELSDEAYALTLLELRAALASPAPAPQETWSGLSELRAQVMADPEARAIYEAARRRLENDEAALQGEEGHAAEVCRCGLPRATAVHGNPFGAGHAYEAAR